MTAGHVIARLAAPALIAGAVIALDQLTKAWILRTWPQPQTGEIELLGQWLALTYVQNNGIAFGLFQGIPHFFTVTSILIVAAAIYFYLRHVPEHDPWFAVMLGLIVGGALGNLIDRLRFGYVIDFIKTLAGHFPVFNLADSAVVTGVLLMVLHSFIADVATNPRLAMDQKDGG